MLSQIKDALKDGSMAGLAVGFLCAVAEAAIALGEASLTKAPTHGYALLPLFFWTLLMPVGALLGAALGVWFWCWHGRSTAQLREAAVLNLRDFRAGSLAPLGWVWGLGIAGAGIGTAAALLFPAIDETFNAKPLAGVLLAAILVAACLLAGVILRRLLIVLGRAVARFRARRPGRPPTNTHLAIASLVAIAAGLSVAAVQSWSTLEDIGLDALMWPVALLIAYVAALSLVVATAPRWRRWRFLPPAAILVLVGGPAAALCLGGSQAVRQASFLQDTPSSALISAMLVASDFDGDGASAFFGGGDCAPFDAKIGPHAIEIAGNGVDDNCISGDATADAQQLRNSRAFAPLPAGFPQKPNLVLVTVDAVRADHSSLGGYGRKTTPRLDRHARSGVVFERAYSQGTGTISSMPSLLTSKYSYQISYVDDQMPPAIDPRETMLAEHLKKAGYSTWSVTPLAYANSGRWGILQGFDTSDQTTSKPQPNDTTTSPKILAIAKDLLRRAQKGKRPFFLWVHFYDPHGKYLSHPNQPSFGSSPADRYDEEILFTDAHVGQLLDIVRSPAFPPTVVVFGSDHGDGFKEDRGKSNHAYGLYNELLHVPLVVWAPNAAPRRVDTPVGNVDIAATLINAAGLKRPFLRGNSLLPYVYDGFRDPERLVFSEKTFGQGAAKRFQKSVTGMDWKMVRWVNERREFLYHLKDDPGEKKNVIQQFPDVAAALRRQIDLFVERNAISTLGLE